MGDQSNETTQNENEELLPGYQNFEQFTQEGYKTLMEAIRNSNSLPSGKDWNYYNTFEGFNKVMNMEGNNVLKHINTVLSNNKVDGNIRNRGLSDKIELMIDANDTILEKVANNIDEMNGIRKTANEPIVLQTVSAHLPINGSWNRINSLTFSINSSTSLEPPPNSSTKSISLLTAKNIIRPQKFFKDKIDNRSNYPWEPRIKEKPNSLKPLAIFLEETENGEEYSHPYEFELERFSPSDDQLRKESPVIPPPVEETPLVEITKPEQINGLVETLMKCKEFAVDLEHHSYRSFMGITCLMQISTRDTDFLIDTLLLRDKLYLLNEVFTKPNIVKIFHGADMDILWLQRDLSIYVVNMFDTHQAAKQLELSGLSLASLMQRYCNFVPNKKFQLADWRIRPLPEELKMYGREDTHYLIYIYQLMKNELLKKANGKDNLLRSVINSSTTICKRRYFKSVLREDSYLDFYRKCKRLFDNRQLYALKELYKWRDEIAREQDESTGYVLPNHMLLQISESLPREMQGVLACCNPIPPLARANLLELHKIILAARDQPLEKPIFKEQTRGRGSTKKISKINVDSPLHCPHDLTATNEFRDDLPTLLGNTMESMTNILLRTSLTETDHATDSIFNSSVESNEKPKEKLLHKITFLGPYERYKLVKPFIQEEEKKLEEERSNMEHEMTETSSKKMDVPESRLEPNEPSIDERIESIRDHFLQLSKKPMPPKTPEKSLLQMGGTKKRKREHSQPDDTDSTSKDLSTTVPDMHKSHFNKNKRKFNNTGNEGNGKKFCNNNQDLQSSPRKKQKKKFFRNNKINEVLIFSVTMCISMYITKICV